MESLWNFRPRRNTKSGIRIILIPRRRVFAYGKSSVITKMFLLKCLQRSASQKTHLKKCICQSSSGKIYKGSSVNSLSRAGLLLPLTFAFPLLLLPSSLVSAAAPKRSIKVDVTANGFVPASVEVKPGTNVTLLVTRLTDSTCSKQIQIPSKGIGKTNLPMNKTVRLAIGKVEKGEIKFGCGMEMMESGQIVVR